MIDWIFGAVFMGTFLCLGMTSVLALDGTLDDWYWNKGRDVCGRNICIMYTILFPIGVVVFIIANMLGMFN
jgi:hypothetical protein